MSEHEDQELVIASLSDVGRVRAANEDYCSEFRTPGGEHLLVVADGMGGHRGGSTASRLAVQAIGEVFGVRDPKDEQLLASAIRTANDRVYRRARQNPELRGMGTTVVMLLLDGGDRGWVAHVGDSRAYRFRDGRLEALTDDHSVVAAMIREGLISEDEAAAHPRRNEILRSVGVDPEVDPEILPLEVRPGDRYLLCSDGLSGLVEDEEIAAVLQREPPSKAVRTLVDTANARGGMDNVTVQIAAVPGGSTTEAGEGSQRPRDGAWRSQEGIERDRQRDLQRVALLVAVLAGLLAAAMLWFVVSQGRPAARLRAPLRGGAESAAPESGAARAATTRAALAWRHPLGAGA